MDNLMDILDKFVHADWFTTFLSGVIICAITVVVARIAVTFTRRVLKRSTLPSSSIFVNLIRAIVWIIGICAVLAICFNVNINGVITGLGVVGIAVSLGFQNTLSNLLGGLQVSLGRSVEPGDNIQMGASGVKGVVQDVTWRYTAIVDSSGNYVTIPNSLMTSTAVIKLAPLSEVSIPLIVTTSSERLTATAHHIEDAAEKAVGRVSKLKKKPSVSFSAIGERGFKGSLSFTIADADKSSAATDAAIRAIAPFVHNHLMEEEAQTLQNQLAADGTAEDPTDDSSSSPDSSGSEASSGTAISSGSVDSSSAAASSGTVAPSSPVTSSGSETSSSPSASAGCAASFGSSNDSSNNSN